MSAKFQLYTFVVNFSNEKSSSTFTDMICLLTARWRARGISKWEMLNIYLIGVQERKHEQIYVIKNIRADDMHWKIS